MKYKTLKAGDIRQEWDEVREIRLSGRIPCTGYTRIRPSKVLKPYTDHVFVDRSQEEPSVTIYGDWKTVSLVGHKILQSDLMHSEFRRP